MPAAQLSIQKIKYGEPYTSAAGQTGIASEDAVVVNVTDDAGSTTHIFLPVSQALQLGRLVTKEAATLIHDAVDDNGKPLYSIRERMQLIYGYKNGASPEQAIAKDNLPDTSRFAELFKEPGLIDGGPAAVAPDSPYWRGPTPNQAWIDEKLHRDLACPECGGPIFISRYPTDGPRSACADSKCKYANGITPFPRQFRPAVDGPLIASGGWSAPSEHFVVEEESITRVPFNAEADTDGDAQPEPKKKTKLRHNHKSQVFVTDGSCPWCADYASKHGIPEEEQ
ncbi:hypothetical protein FDH86_gp001 [Arthrobacter phage Tank]|uniref:Uncharacterized protein n=1 Tax=Arthrobacter phage Tank TaxID=1772319 RepID=A0A0U4KS12_9CAUD|nr:hypothetical protein FDH86_gp001 [Arthrobacter phage Tank]ALY10536.1 hypothetical protein TANK_1 [Arthrobacter phage Tank]